MAVPAPQSEKGALLPDTRRRFRQKRTVGNIWQLGREPAKDFACGQAV